MVKISQNTLRLLKKGEIEEIYSIPQINENARSFVFSLNDAEQKILSQLHTLTSKVAFILQLGFFRLKKRFYPIDELDQLEDLKEYVMDRYFSDYPGCGIHLAFLRKKPARQKIPLTRSYRL